jgi:2,3-dihydroxybenzoate-AMP ligase
MEGCVSWPVEMAERYRREGHWAGMTIGQMFEASVRAHATRTALVAGKQRLTYAELGARVECLAAHLLRLGFETYDRVILQLPNVAEFVIAYFACQRIGVIPLTCLTAFRQAEVEYFARFIEATGYVVPAEFRGFDHVAMAREIQNKTPALRHVVVVDGAAPGTVSIRELLETAPDPVWQSQVARRQPEPSEPAVFLLSGGTTGVPKVIPRTHDDFLCATRASAAGTGVSADTVMLLTLPITHVLPLACPGLQGALMHGAKVVLAPSPDPTVAFPLIERERVTYTPLVPTALIGWINSPRRAEHDLSSLRAMPTGGMKMTAELARKARAAFGDAVMQEYGASEGFICSTRPGDPLDWRYDTQGRPVSAADEFRIVDDAGHDVAPGEVGELLGRGPYTIRGYYRASEYNAAAFTAEGFYRTGDMVRRHPSGNLVIEGRKKDMINRGGEHISAEEVEGHILGHAGVVNVAVVAMPDPTLGERCCAYVVLRPGERLSLEELTRFLLEQRRIAKFKVPERLQIVESLPLTAVGKVSKPALRLDIQKKLESQRKLESP